MEMKKWKRALIVGLAVIFWITNMPVGIVYAGENDNSEKEKWEKEQKSIESEQEFSDCNEEEVNQKESNQTEPQSEEDKVGNSETETESVTVEENVTEESEIETSEADTTETEIFQEEINNRSLSAYFFTGNETIWVEQTGDFQVNAEQTKATGNFHVSLSGYESERNVSFPVTYIVKEDGEEIDQGEFVFSSNASVNIAVSVPRAGEINISFFGEGIEEIDGKIIEEIREIGSINCACEKQEQVLIKEQEEINLQYGDSIAIGEVISLLDNRGQSIPTDLLQISEVNPLHGKSILQMEEGIIRAIAINGEERGETVLQCYCPETTFSKASEVISIPVYVEKVYPITQLSVQESHVSMYGFLQTEMTIMSDNTQYQDLLQTDKNIKIHYEITGESGIAQRLGVEDVTNGKQIFKSWVTPWEFFPFKKGKQFIFRAIPVYQGDFSPYIFEMQESGLVIGSCNARMEVNIEDEGKYDYREDYSREKQIEIDVFKESLFIEKEISEDEKRQLQVNIHSNNEKVIKPLQANTSQNVSQKYFDCRVEGVGDAVLTIQISGGDIYEFEEVQIPVSVSNSGIREEDIQICYTSENPNKFFYTEKKAELQQLLDKQQNWLNGTLELSITDIGKKYYDEIGLKIDAKESQAQDGYIFQQESPVREYQYWLCKEERNANTALHESGTGTLSFGIDRTEPMNREFQYNKNDFKPSRGTDQIYYAEDFWVSGSFTDEYSGIDTIQYATDQGLENWIDLPRTWKRGSNEVHFELFLGHGSYEVVAIRCIDVAGNVSESRLVEENGEPLSIIVDATEPRLVIHTRLNSQSYQAEWTNKQLITEINEMPQPHFLSGIMEIQAQYVKIGEELKEENWESIEKLSNTSEERANVFETNHVFVVTMGGETPEKYINQNGTYFYRAISNSGVITNQADIRSTAVRVRQQQTMTEMSEMIETGGEKYHKNEWYNKKTGVPILSFQFPDYEDGRVSKEYQAPITIHTLIERTDEKGNKTYKEQTAGKGIFTDADFQQFLIEQKKGMVEDDIQKLQFSFDYDSKTGYAEDGIYRVSYWLTDEAGNESAHREKLYKVDTHEPTSLEIILDGELMEAENKSVITYQKFYQNTIQGKVKADFGMSGRDGIKLLKAKKIGNWNQQNNWIGLAGSSFTLTPNLRCFLYMKAEDIAGNQSEIWTNGIVIDKEAPTGENGPEFIIEPEGANKNGFFNTDIDVNISVLEAPGDENFAGIETVLCRIGVEEGGKRAGQEEAVFTFSKEAPTEEDIQKANRFAKTILVNAKENESNYAYIEIVARDRCGNEANSMETLKIDVTKPVVTVNFEDDNAMKNGRYYNHDRIATLTVQEKNFNPDGVEILVQRDNESYVIKPQEWEHTEDIHRARVVFQEDGDYEVSVGCMDLADNESEELMIEPFTIDQTVPIVTVSYDNDLVKNGMYYQNQRIATITITEHNFSEEAFEIICEKELKMTEWKHDGDVHTTTILFSEDEHYRYQLAYKDLADNQMEAMQTQEFYIDRTKPVILIQGLENNSANAGDIYPVVWIQEKNISLQDVHIQVVTGKGQNVEVNSQIRQTEETTEYVLTNLSEQDDEIYYLTVETMDLAGNCEELTYRYSLNRSGSTYDLTQMQKYVERWYNKYDDLSDLEILEMNVDKIEDFALYVSRNGKLLQAIQSKSREKKLPDTIYYDVIESGNEQLGYTYQYVIYQENFEAEGLYHIAFYSKDYAGNEVNNTISEKDAKIQFVIDNTVPLVVLNGIETGKVYNVDSKEVNVLVTDNCKLKAAVIYLMNAKGETVKEWDYLQQVMEGEVLSMEIPGYDGKLSLAYEAIDMAGNEIMVLQKSGQLPQDFLITTNPVIQYVHSTRAKTSTVVIVLFTITAISTAVYKKERKGGCEKGTRR